MSAFIGMKQTESLDEFHQRCVVPTKEETIRRNAEIDRFVQFLYRQFNNSPYTVDEVRKSGSLGKGTAVRGSADIDLVMVLNGLNNIMDLTRERERLLNLLREAVTNDREWKGQVHLNNQTSYSLSYTLNGQEVDILPALNLFPDGMSRSSKQKVYDRMKSYPHGWKKASQEFSVLWPPCRLNL